MINGHLLDSSVVRPMLLGTTTYKQYFASQFDDQACFVSPFIRMELYRSYLRNVIEFYATLNLPTISNLSDAITFWSNRYQGSKHKAVQQLLAKILDHHFSQVALQDKEVAKQAIAILIQEFIHALQTEFQLLVTDSTQCTRAAVTLNIENDDFMAAIIDFSSEFDDVVTCRNQCQIHRFLLQDHKAILQNYVHQAESLPKNSTNRGFLAICTALQILLEQGEFACSCRFCERIGDVVIALDAPRHLQIEHTDQAFDSLCPPIDQPHRKHPSETQVLQQPTH